MSNPKLEFGGLKKTSLIEWPGKVATIAFTGGCNLRCPYCQNPDLVLKSPELPRITEDEVLDHLNEKRKWLDGIVVTGGEPTIHPRLIDFARKVREAGFEFGLETNGTDPETLEKLIARKLVDYIAMDVKAPLDDEVKYRTVTRCDGLSINDIRESVRLIKEAGIDYEFRTTVVPTLLTLEEVCRIARQVSGAKRYCLQQFVPDNALNEVFQRIAPYQAKELEYLRDRISGRFEECEIRGVEPFKT